MIPKSSSCSDHLFLVDIGHYSANGSFAIVMGMTIDLCVKSVPRLTIQRLEIWGISSSYISVYVIIKAFNYQLLGPLVIVQRLNETHNVYPGIDN